MNYSLTDRLKAEAARLGFVACGIAPADATPQSAARLREWLASGAHGEMLWMETRESERASPAGLWPEVRSILMLGMSYAPSADPRMLEGQPGVGRFAAYAQGQDYHDIVKKALKALARWLVAEAPDNALKVFVDTAPVMEKPLAEAAGLGWQGKHSNLVSREHGSWLLLGALMTTLDLVSDAPARTTCGSCSACLNACPTNAFPAPFRLDARRCISYLTIEAKGPIPREHRRAIGNRVYGCDDCLAACPWNKFAAAAAANRAFLPRAELTAPAIADLLALDDAAFRLVFSGSPIKRIGRDRMVRNALVAAGNSSDTALTERVSALLDDPSPLVRGAAVWALAELAPERLSDEAWRSTHEEDADVRAEWALARPAASPQR